MYEFSIPFMRGMFIQNNHDGNNDNLSSNCGAEGETNDPEIISLRHQQAKNFMAILPYLGTFRSIPDTGVSLSCFSAQRRSF
jgi:hypothetical protein